MRSFDPSVVSLRVCLCVFRCACQVTLEHVVVGNVASGSGEIGSPPPKPLAYLIRSDEAIGGGGIAPHRAPQCVSVHLHRGPCWNGHIVLRQDRHAHTDHHDSRVKISECENSEQEWLSLAPLASEWTQNAKNIMISFKSQQKTRQFGP